MVRKKRSRAFLYSFVGTLAILVGVTAALYYNSQQVPRLHFPSPLPAYSAVWAGYVPSNAVSMSFVNFTMIRAANSSLPQITVLLPLASPRLSINASDVEYHLAVSLATPNSTVDVLFIRPERFRVVASAFGQQVPGPEGPGSTKVYPVRAVGATGASDGWAALVGRDSAVVFSEGANDARAAVQACLSVLAGNGTSLIAAEGTRQLLYTVGGPGGHYSIGVQNFPGVVRAGSMTLVTVDGAAGYVQVSYSVKFPGGFASSSELAAVKSAYLNAHQFAVYDSVVKAVQLDPPGSLGADYRLVG